MCTPKNAPKLAALRAQPGGRADDRHRGAPAQDPADPRPGRARRRRRHPRRVPPDERHLRMTPEQRVEWEAEVRSLYDGMVRIVDHPDVGEAHRLRAHPAHRRAGADGRAGGPPARLTSANPPDRPPCRWREQDLAPCPRPHDALSRFSEPTRTWFAAAFAEPTPAQVGAWEAIGAGQHALVVAPTGLRQDAERVPVEPRPAAHQRATGRQDQAAPGCSTSARSRRSRSTSSATCAARSPASATPATGSASRSPR